MNACWDIFLCSRSINLQNIAQRKYAINNPYTILLPLANKEIITLQNPRYFHTNCNYTGFDSGELTFAIGDILEVEGAYSKRYIYRAKHTQTGLIGNISMAHLDSNPIIELQSWYFHNITRSEARQLILNTNEVGTFLVRKSLNIHDKMQKYSLSVRDVVDGLPVVRHFKIMYDTELGYYISDGCFCKHLDILIKLYQDDECGELGLKPKLTSTCPKDIRFSVPANYGSSSDDGEYL